MNLKSSIRNTVKESEIMSNTKKSRKTSCCDNNAETAEELLQKGKTAYKAKDFETAAKYFKKAAELGNADAQFFLGVCYDKGIGVGQDSAEATKWIRKSAEQGVEQAKAALKRIGAE